METKKYILAPKPDWQCARDMREVMVRGPKFSDDLGCRTCGLLHPHVQKSSELNILDIHHWPRCKWCQIKFTSETFGGDSSTCTDKCLRSCVEYWSQQDAEFHPWVALISKKL